MAAYAAVTEASRRAPLDSLPAALLPNEEDEDAGDDEDDEGDDTILLK